MNTSLKSHLSNSDEEIIVSLLYVSFVYRWYTLPGHVLPARPLRYSTCALETGTVISLFIPSSNTFIRTKPQSTTVSTSGTVIEVSAMFVDKTTLVAHFLG